MHDRHRTPANEVHSETVPPSRTVTATPDHVRNRGIQKTVAQNLTGLRISAATPYQTDSNSFSTKSVSFQAHTETAPRKFSAIPSRHRSLQKRALTGINLRGISVPVPARRRIHGGPNYALRPKYSPIVGNRLQSYLRSGRRLYSSFPRSSTNRASIYQRLRPRLNSNPKFIALTNTRAQQFIPVGLSTDPYDRQLRVLGRNGQSIRQRHINSDHLRRLESTLRANLHKVSQLRKRVEVRRLRPSQMDSLQQQRRLQILRPGLGTAARPRPRIHTGSPRTYTALPRIYTRSPGFDTGLPIDRPAPGIQEQVLTVPSRRTVSQDSRTGNLGYQASTSLDSRPNVADRAIRPNGHSSLNLAADPSSFGLPRRVISGTNLHDVRPMTSSYHSDDSGRDTVGSDTRSSPPNSLAKSLSQPVTSDFNGNGHLPHDRTLDEIISDTYVHKGVSSYSQLSTQADSEGFILSGLDMKLTPQQYALLLSEPIKRKKRKAARFAKWPRGVVPYEFTAGDFESIDKQVIRGAMDQWEMYTCLTFRPAKVTDHNKVIFRNGIGCSSNVGMRQGSQAITLQPECREQKIVLHELGHAVGLIHEHQRQDRDQFIKIIFSNIRPSGRKDFAKFTHPGISTMGVPYDFTSIMHYGPKAFSRSPDLVTMVTKDPNYQNIIGKGNYLSTGDAEIINRLYGCKERGITVTPPITTQDPEIGGELDIGKTRALSLSSYPVGMNSFNTKSTARRKPLSSEPSKNVPERSLPTSTESTRNALSQGISSVDASSQGITDGPSAKSYGERGSPGSSGNVFNPGNSSGPKAGTSKNPRSSVKAFSQGTSSGSSMAAESKDNSSGLPESTSNQRISSVSPVSAFNLRTNVTTSDPEKRVATQTVSVSAPVTETPADSAGVLAPADGASATARGVSVSVSAPAAGMSAPLSVASSPAAKTSESPTEASAALSGNSAPAAKASAPPTGMSAPFSENSAPAAKASESPTGASAPLSENSAPAAKAPASSAGVSTPLSGIPATMPALAAELLSSLIRLQASMTGASRPVARAFASERTASTPVTTKPPLIVGLAALVRRMPAAPSGVPTPVTKASAPTPGMSNPVSAPAGKLSAPAIEVQPSESGVSGPGAGGPSTRAEGLASVAGGPTPADVAPAPTAALAENGLEGTKPRADLSQTGQMSVITTPPVKAKVELEPAEPTERPEPAERRRTQHSTQQTPLQRSAVWVRSPRSATGLRPQEMSNTGQPSTPSQTPTLTPILASTSSLVKAARLKRSTSGHLNLA